MLVPHTRDLRTMAAPLSFVGLHIGTRMTVLRLPSGGLLVHSPIALDAAREAVLAEGTVTHIVAPSLYHHVHAAAWADAFPEATTHAPRALAKKRPDLRIDRPLEEATTATFEGALVPVSIDGCMLHETVFVHPASRSVVSSDLVECFSSCEHAPTRLFLKAAGVWGQPGWNRFLRFLYRDKRAARRSVDALLEHDFDRLTIAHGDVIETGAKSAIRSTFRFLD